MKILHYIHVHLALAFYAWAERDINKLHPDLNHIVMRRLELRDKLARLHG